MKRKKVLFVLNSLRFGGAEKQTVSLINNLDTSRFEMTLAYIDDVTDFLPQIYKNKLQKIFCFHRKGKFDYNLIKQLNQMIRKHDFDIVVCVNHYSMFNVFVCKFLVKADFRLFTVCHNTIQRPGLWVKIKNKLYKRIMNRCYKIIFVCKNQMDYWIKNFRINPDISAYIYNGIDVEYFRDLYSEEYKSKLKESFGFNDNDFIAGICAALRPEKKHKDFVDAIKNAQKRGFNIKGLIIGDGALRKEIQDYIFASGLADRIKITGFQKDVRPYISICNCMTLTSHAVETFSIAALEAMSMAKPVLLSDIGGADEQIEHGVTGYLFQKGDIKALTDYLISLFNGDNADMGIKARNRVAANFSVSSMVDNYEKLFW